MYQLGRQLEAGEEPPPLSHTISTRNPAKHFATHSPHVMSLPPSTAGSFAVESSDRPTVSRPSHSGVICLTLTAAVLALLFFLLAALVPVRLVHVVSSVVSSALLLTSASSPTYAAFASNADNPLLLSVYVYNVTNAADMLNHSAPAALDELGPFVFTDTRRKLNPAFTPPAPTTPATLTYTDWQTLAFVPERSCARCTLDVNITTVNLVTQAGYHTALTQLTMANSSQLLDDFHLLGFSTIQRSGLLPLLFTTRSVRDVLFGYEDSAFEVSFPGYMPNQTLAATSATNYRSAIRTGVDNAITAHQYVSWQNQSLQYTCVPGSNPALCAWNTTVWATDAASTVQGSDGIIFTDQNGINASSSPVLFFYPFRRTVALEYSGASSYSGLSTLDFSFPASFFRSSAVNASNSDYYQYLDGAINLTSTASFTPLFATLPHLIDVDTSSPLYPHDLTVSNAQVNPSTANTFSIHPPTGVLAHVSTSFQLNVLLQPINFTVDQYGEPVTVVWGGSLTAGLLPLFYATEEGGLSGEQIRQLLFVDEVKEVFQWSPYGFWPAAAVCAIAAVGGSVWLWRTCRAEVEAIKGVKEDEAGGAGVGFDEKSRLRVAAGGYGWYGQEQTDLDEDDDGI